MKILLISCYELGRQPLGLSFPAAQLLADAWPVECRDLSVEEWDDEPILKASFIGISVPMHTAIRLGVKVAERVRRVNPSAHICFYGLYASLNGDVLLKAGADSIIGGEVEEPLVNWVRQLAGLAFENLDGIRTASRPSGPYLGRQELRPPARHLLPPLDRYAKLETGSRLKLVGAVEASRGCAHKCLHCPITPVYNGRMQIVQEEVVLDDIRNLVSMGAEHFTFCDPDFLNGVNHSMRIVHRMSTEFPQLSFDVTAKIQHILEYREQITELGRLGCVFIQSAVESLNDTILGYLLKEHTRSDVDEALEITRTAGIALRPSLVSFTPWTSLEDYIELLAFVEKQGLIYHVDPVQFAIRLLVPPGSSLLGMDPIRPFIRELDPERFTYLWEHPDSRMTRLESEVNRVVERAVKISEDPAETFAKIKGLALSAQAGKAVTVSAPIWQSQTDRPPRLTESWFCCAEPTMEQMLPIAGREALKPETCC